MTGCPYAENSRSVRCYTGCKAERLQGHWKVCAGSRFDPLPLPEIQISSTGLTNSEGLELFEVYQAGEYQGSCYAVSEEEAASKARTGQWVELASVREE